MQKSRPTQAKKAISKVQDTQTSHNNAITPELDNSYNHDEPFSFAQKKNSDKISSCNNPFNSELFDNLLDQNIIGDLKKVMNNCVNSTSCSIAATLTNTNAQLVEEILSKLSLSASNSVQENMAISQDLVACRDAKDVLNFQKKIFETNFSNIINLYIGINSVMQNFASKNLDLLVKGSKNIL
jgi:hypothetical protein